MSHGGGREFAFEYFSRLKRAREYVDQHFREAISLQDVANAAGTEKKYFSRLFRRKTGMRFQDWLRYVRISEAIRLIKAQDNSLTEIAFEAGFSDLRTFERAFKRVTGQTACRFRNRYLSKRRGAS
jgi:two-component system response regulator YesN